MSRVRADEFTNTEANGAPTFTHGVQVGTGATISGSTNTITALTNGTERLRITAGGLLDVSGGIQVTENVTPTSGRGVEIFEASAGVGQIQSYNRTGGSWDELKLKGSEVRIHTGSSNALTLDLQSTASTLYGTSDGILNLDTTDSRGAFIRFKENGSTKGWVGSAEGMGGGISGDQDDLGVRALDNIMFSANGAERLRIDSSGHALFSTTLSRIVEDWSGNGPQGKIQIEGTNSDAIMSIISNGTSDAFRCGTLALGRTRSSSNSQDPPTIVQNGDTLGAITFCGSDGVDMRSKAAYIRCEVHGSPGTDDMPGMLYLATRPDGGVAPVKRHRIGNGGMISTFADLGWESNIFYNANGAGSSRSFIIGRHSATGLDAVGGTAGTSSFEVYTNGNIVNTNNSYGQISDVSLKENIVDANSQWADIKSVKVRNFNFKEGQTHKQIGVVAQELEAVSPGLVYENRDNLKGVNTSVLYMKALGALQEAMARIETLESEVTALKG